MFELNTDPAKRSKKVLMDGYTYLVRKPGAGDSLAMQQAGRELTALGKKEKLTAAEEEKVNDLTIDSLEKCLDLFDWQGDDAAKKHLYSLDPETLIEAVGQIFGEASSEPAAAS